MNTSFHDAQQAAAAQAAKHQHTDSDVGWWPRSISDGDAHYGLRAPDGIVTARCGVMFVPLVNPYLHKAVRQHSPADEAHACRACRDKRQAGP